MHEHGAHRQAKGQAHHGARGHPGGGFCGDDGEQLPPREAEVAQQAELLAPRQHLGRQARGNADKADDDGHRLQVVGDGKAAVEDAQRSLAQLAGGGEVQHRRVGQQRAQRRHHASGLGAGCEPQRQVGEARVPGDLPVVRALHRHRAELARKVAVHAAHVGCGGGGAGRRDGQHEERARLRAIEGLHGLADEEVGQCGVRGQSGCHQGQGGGGVGWRCRRQTPERPRQQTDRRAARFDLQRAHA